MEKFSITAAAAEDIPVIKQLADSIWPVTYKDILTSAQVDYMMELFYSTDSLQKQFLDSRFIIGRMDDKPVAFASFGPSKEDSVFKLHKIYLSPVLQGKGIGRIIIDHIISEIKPEGAVALDLNVNRENPALGFYRKLGFEIIRVEDNDIGNGYWMNDYVMRKGV